MAKTHIERLLKMTSRAGVLRPRDLKGHGIARTYLRQAVQSGLLRRSGRGVYTLPDLLTEHQSVMEVCARVPGGVVCLLSALAFHNFTTQLPPEVWLAIGEKARKPRLEYPLLRVVRFSGKALSEGVEARRVGGATVRVYCPAKTVADCFKYRNKIGLDVAMEALRECWRERKATMDELWKYAQICRVANVMRPYLEAMVA
jgi:predicted transcriptional regulator of viral defense system